MNPAPPGNLQLHSKIYVLVSIRDAVLRLPGSVALAVGTQGLPPRHKSWKSSQASPFPPAIIPLYQKNPGPYRAQSRSMFGSLPPGPSSGPPTIAYPECGCQLGFLQHHEFSSHTMFVLICTFVTLYFYLCRSYHSKLLF